MINDKDKLTNYLIIFFLIFFSTSYLLKLNYVIGIRDEIIYLSDSLLLLEGITPAHSYSPSGLSTWLGTLVVLIDFLINKFSISGIDILFNNFDLIISKHYQNLTYIKLSLFFFNIALLSYLFFIDKNKYFFLLFFILFLLPSFYEVTFAGTPYFIASIFCSISIILKDRNKFLLTFKNVSYNYQNESFWMSPQTKFELHKLIKEELTKKTKYKNIEVILDNNAVLLLSINRKKVSFNFWDGYSWVNSSWFRLFKIDNLFGVNP